MKNTKMSKDSHILLNIKMIIGWKTTLNYEKADLDQLIEKKLVTTQKDKKSTISASNQLLIWWNRVVPKKLKMENLKN